ncbi:hypothetical protein N7522_010593 [Penicillium canescens]|nr:hypothetical protein N7522_010593 [Penicillium canescens]
MAEEAPKPVACTYSSCMQMFWNMGDMITHKITYKHHFYCLPCDLDFHSEQALYLHTTTSDSHITCTHCGLEFRSQGGLDVHIKSNHEQVKKVPCNHCDAPFKSASAVIMHVENGKCPVVNEEGQRRGEVKAKAPGRKHILDMGRVTSSPEPQAAQSSGSSEDNEREGGVRLDLASNPTHHASSAAFAQRSGPSPSSEFGIDSSRDSLPEQMLAARRSLDLEPGGVSLYQQIPVYAPDSSRDGLVRRPNPSEFSGALPLMEPFELVIPSPITDGALPVYQPIPVYPPDSTRDGRFPHADPNEQSGPLPLIPSLGQPSFTVLHHDTVVRSNPFLSTSTPNVAGLSQHDMNIPRPSVVSHRKLLNVDPQEFWNPEKGRFFCNCGISFLTVREFHTHIIVDDDGTIKDCPRCFKRFNSLAALVAHVEAPQSKCAAFADDDVEDEINEITRGFATFKSHRNELEMGEDLISLDTSSENYKPTTAAQTEEDKKLAAELWRLKFE